MEFLFGLCINLPTVTGDSGTGSFCFDKTDKWERFDFSYGEIEFEVGGI